MLCGGGGGKCEGGGEEGGEAGVWVWECVVEHSCPKCENL